ncbi:hypothetical protein ACIBG4_40790 [Nonomuraea sp. NPDC050383]|uniref:hypothetical protein n=1 Tax=Nonomuraea sp. NPDC050383 TaxID=3364362 RepID=UPI0037BD9FB7
MGISVDLNAIAARQRQRLADALYELDAVSVALEDVTAERDEARAEVERLRAAPDA